MYGENITFRPASPDSGEDARELKALARRVIRHNYTPFLGEELTTAFIDGGLADKEIDDGLGRCVVLAVDGRVAAFAVTRGDLLHLLMVDVPFQRRGYGSLLLAHVERMLFAEHGRIVLQSFQANSAAARFYLKQGWRIAEEQDDPDSGLVMLHFAKQKPHEGDGYAISRH